LLIFSDLGGFENMAFWKPIKTIGYFVFLVKLNFVLYLPKQYTWCILVQIYDAWAMVKLILIYKVIIFYIGFFNFNMPYFLENIANRKQSK
jgi:hypothetical protein